MELRELVAKEIERSIRVRILNINGVQTAHVDDLNKAADRILAIPEIAEALAAHRPIYLHGEGSKDDANWPLGHSIKVRD